MRRIKIYHKYDLILPEHRIKFWKKNPKWEIERIESMMKNIQPNDLVCDIGAEEGDITALLAQQLNLKSRMYIIEPSPGFWSNIKSIWIANNLPNPQACFIGFASNETNLDPENNNIGNPIRLKSLPDCKDEIREGIGFRHLAQEFDATPQIKLDDFIDKVYRFGAGHINYPSFITMDIEGSEFEALKGMRNLINIVRPIIYISIHPIALKDFWNQNSEDIFDYMSKYGYESKLLAIDHEEHWVFWNPEERQLKL